MKELVVWPCEYWIKPMEILSAKPTSEHGQALTTRLELTRAAHSGKTPNGAPESTAIQRVLAFAQDVERELSEVVGSHCVLYWLHAIRMFRPPIVTADPIVAFQLRSAVETAIQKHAPFDTCDGIGWSDSVELDTVFDGLLTATADAQVPALLRRCRIPVLTRFRREELDELQFVHQACAELQGCLIALRSMVWRGRLIVNDWSAFDLTMSADLVGLTEDGPIALGPWRQKDEGADPNAGDAPAAVLLANYNVLPRRPHGVASFVKAPLYSWYPVSLLELYRRHRALEEDFRARTGCDLAAILTVIGSLSVHAVTRWSDPSTKAAHWYHAMESVCSRDALVDELLGASGVFSERHFGGIAVARDAFLAALDFLMLTPAKRGRIDPLIGLPRFPLIPSGSGLLVDYGGLIRVVDDLFFRVRLGSAQFQS